jgi:hypothetical protein
MQWTALLQLENCIEDTRDNLTAKTSDIWTLPINERLVIKYFRFFNFLYSISSDQKQN